MVFMSLFIFIKAFPTLPSIIFYFKENIIFICILFVTMIFFSNKFSRIFFIVIWFLKLLKQYAWMRTTSCVKHFDDDAIWTWRQKKTLESNEWLHLLQTLIAESDSFLSVRDSRKRNVIFLCEVDFLFLFRNF